jgi:hypothetical protein
MNGGGYLDTVVGVVIVIVIVVVVVVVVVVAAAVVCSNNCRSSRSDRLCGLVVRVLGYRSGGPGSFHGATRKKK